MDAAFKLPNENPKKNANFISKLFFGWAIKLLYEGTKRPLKLNDLYKALSCDESESLGSKLEVQWLKEVEYAKAKGRQPSLLKALTKTFFKQYMIYGILVFLCIICLRSPQPAVLSWLIQQFQKDTISDRTSMYAAAGSLVSMSICIIFLLHHANFGQGLVGMRVRVAVSSLIYRKIMKLNKKSQNETAGGQVVNLLSNDVQRFDLIGIYLHYIWIMPFQVALVSYFLWNAVGISCLTGILSMILCTLPLQSYLGKIASSLRQKVAERTDARVKLMSEIITGIQVIKMYAWEKPFECLINHLRAREIHVLTKTSYLRGFYMSCMVFIERSTLCLTLICFTMLGNHIRPDIVFSMAQFFNQLQSVLAIMYPMAISLGAETLVAIKRIEDFLKLEEKQPSNNVLETDSEIAMINVKASWIPHKIALNDINLIVPKGALCAVIGPVGAGKTSLLQLLLGEIPFTTGQIRVGGNLSYASQEPWLFAASVRKNIVFGKPFNHVLYGEVTKACALKSDFEQLPFGDKSLVGERGVSLSGGQRARINLARAIYRQADIYLLDDPLSAVDTHVGKHLFNKCIVKYLRGKTRILVTHQLQYLKKADLIVVLNEGKIEAMGTFEDLISRNLDFTKMLASADESNETADKEKGLLLEQNHESVKVTRMNSLTNSGVLSQSFQSYEEVEEEGEIGGQAGETPFWDYIKSVGGTCFIFSTLFILILSQTSCTACDLWVTYWTSQEELRYSSDMTVFEPISVYSQDIHKNELIYTHELTGRSFNNSSILANIFDDVATDDGVLSLIKTNVAMYIYGGLIIITILLTTGRSFLFFKAAMKSSKNIHMKMFSCLLETPMRFFDTNPSGRILNRFSKDIGAIDEILPRVLMEAVQILLVMVGILVNITISNYYMIIAMILLGVIFLKLRSWYISSAKDIKHLEGIAKSPVFSYVSSTLNGLTTIRVCEAQDVLISEFNDHQDVHTSAWFLTLMCISFFGLWLDIICVIFIACIAFGFVLSVDLGYNENSSFIGLALSQSMILTGMLQYGMRQTAEVVNQLTSVERVLQYTKLDQEGPFETPKGKLPVMPWPMCGKIEFKNLTLFYSVDQAAVLKHLNILILSGEKVGIVGRTGAGKSSLISALFRLAPTEGQILIDDLDIKNIGLNDLRRKISIIPQEPVLFSASLRYNLDPFDEFDDDKLWTVLEEVELKDMVNTLDFEVSGSGSNFSLGQRQLICLARALLRNNKILILDEATANVDARTDGLIQTTIRKKFGHCTVLTIAHRLNTIMDSDKVIVMGGGRVLEFDHPYKLLQKDHGHFTKMVMETGPSMTEQLKDVAMNAWEQKRDRSSELNF